MNPFLAPGKSRPIVVGHRGVPLLHQENTLAGFRRAVALGVPAVEEELQATPIEYAVWIKKVEEFARESRTEALNSFYGHTVVRDRENTNNKSKEKPKESPTPTPKSDQP